MVERRTPRTEGKHPFRTSSRVGVAVAMLCVATVGGLWWVPSAGATSAGFSSQWAYGATYNGSGTWTNSTNGYSASLHAFFGWHTILTQTASADGGIAVEAQRTIALDYAVAYCKSPCNTAMVNGSVSYAAWETEVGFANFTTSGSVYENGAPVPAVGLLNLSDRAQGNVTSTGSLTSHGLLDTRTSSYYFSVAAAAHASVSFPSGLGLVPLSLSNGATWNSSSLASAEGGWSASFDYRHTTLLGVGSRITQPLSGSVTGNASVAVAGADLGPLQLADGSTTDIIALQLSGPFHVREGFLFVPADADLFGSGTSGWTGYQNDSAGISTSALNIGPHSAHLGFLASSTSYTPESSSPTAVQPMPAATSGSAVVQAQPESVPAAQTGSTCLLAGDCPNQAAPPPPLKGLGFSGLLLIVGVLVIGLLLLLAVVERRRAIPPPSHPNARLYPPGAAGFPAPSPPGSTSAPPGPANPKKEPDPLDNLW